MRFVDVESMVIDFLDPVVSPVLVATKVPATRPNEFGGRGGRVVRR